MHYTLFIPSPIERYLGSCQSGAIVYTAALRIWVQSSAQTYTLSSLMDTKRQTVGSDSRRGTLSLSSLRWLYHSHPAVHERSQRLTLSPASDVARVSNFNCCFNFQFLMTHNVRHLFVCLFAVCYLLLWGVSVHVLLPIFFKWVVYFLNVNSPSSLYILDNCSWSDRFFCKYFPYSLYFPVSVHAWS